jgi:hypothetical protein
MSGTLGNPLNSRRVIQILGITLFACRMVPAQIAMQNTGSSAVRIFQTDMAVLEAQEARKDLPCSVVAMKTFLGFDLRFHAGYDVTVPLKELSGGEDVLTMIFRVTPEGKKDDPVYFSQRINVPSIEDDAKGDAYLQGVFDLGEGKYHVDWLMRDRAERVCSSYWDVDASLPARDKAVSLMISPAVALASESEPFKDEPPVERERTGTITVKVLVHFAPQNSHAATLQPLDTNALISILRGIAREPRITRFSVVAFNLQERRVVYRQENADQINFPALGEALNSLKLGTIDLKRLGEKKGESEFLAKLIADEMQGSERPDALIFAGPKTLVEQKIEEESLGKVAPPEYPVFYMNYNFNPQNNPWRDAIGNAVRFFKGQEYTISRPRDLWFAWRDIMSKIVSLRFGRRGAAPPSD